jgi:type IV secretion system protein TrbL
MSTGILAADFGGFGPDLLNDVANRYINAINSGFGLIKGDVAFVLNVLIVLSVVWSALLWTLSDDQVILQFARKIVYIGIFAWIVQNWQLLTDKLANSFIDLGLKAGGFDTPMYYTSQPGNIAYLGYTTAQPLIDQIGRLCGPVAFFKNFPEILFLALAVAAVVAAFCIITIQVVVAILSFKFGSLAAFVLVPFAVLAKTAFIAERPLGWVVGSGVKLMVLTLVLGIGNGIFQRLRLAPGSTVTTYEAFCIALAALLLMVLSLVASRLASDLIIGGPSLGAGTAAAAVALSYRTTAGAIGSRPAVLATKAAAAIPTKGASLAWQAGGAALRGAQFLAGAGAAGSKAAAVGRAAPAAASASRNGVPRAAQGGSTAVSSRISGPIRVSVTRRAPPSGGSAYRNVRGLLT